MAAAGTPVVIAEPKEVEGDRMLWWAVAGVAVRIENQGVPVLIAMSFARAVPVAETVVHSSSGCSLRRRKTLILSV